MSTQTIKSTMRDTILVGMADYVDKAVLQILSNLIEEQLVRVNVEEITTLPAEVDRSVDEQNKYIIQLFLIKKGRAQRRNEIQLPKCRKEATYSDRQASSGDDGYRYQTVSQMVRAAQRGQDREDQQAQYGQQ